MKCVFNEGNPLRYGVCSVYSERNWKKKKKKNFVQWQTRTETRFVVHSEPSGVSLEGGNAPRRSFEPVWRGLKQPHRNGKKKWNNMYYCNRSAIERKRVLFFLWRLRFGSVSSTFIFRKGNKWNLWNVTDFAISLTSPEKLTWGDLGTEVLNWTRIWNELRSGKRSSLRESKLSLK